VAGDASFDGPGGGISGGIIVLRSTTIAYNKAYGGPFSGAGVYTTTSLTAKNTIIGRNVSYPSGATAGGSLDDCTVFGPSTSEGHNISSDDDCGFIRASDRDSTNPRIEPLADNGGPTNTIALRPTSLAVDRAAKPCPPPYVDQRGVSRPKGPRCDIGAFELVRP
jgi:hypothetical protein